MTTNPPTSELVAAARTARGLSIAEFAALLGYSSHAVIGWECGEPVPERAMAKIQEMERESQHA